jgi:hypothetical protein
MAVNAHLAIPGPAPCFYSDARKGRISTVNIAISSNDQEDGAKGVINVSGLFAC